MSRTDTLAEIAKSTVSTPDDWIPGDEIDRQYSPDSYPEHDHMGGGTKIFEWFHESREECVELWYTQHEDKPYGVQVQNSHALQHSHGGADLREMLGACSITMYMLNHFDFSRKHENDHIEGYEDRIEELEQIVEDEQSRREALEGKNETLRKQLNTMAETVTTGYDCGNWHGMIQQPQLWRPPSTEEIRQLGFYIDRFWYDNMPDSESEISNTAQNVVADSYIIVLEDFRSVVTNTQDKMMFMLHKTDGLYTTFLWKEDHSMVEVFQRDEMRDDGSRPDRVVSFGSES